ncbi:MAG: VCBS repeat-containing protein [Sediminibacterium sp.]
MFLKTVKFCSIPLFFMMACTPVKQDNEKNALFELLDAAKTGIGFTNKLTDTKEMNILNYHNFYNGGGVAIGDIDHDGQPDIFFTSNQGENKLYLNKGNLQFEDVSSKANITSKHKWHTGVSMVDINGDGWLDIYVCNAGILAGDDRSNELYINQKNGTFREDAHAYGLDDKGSSTQAIFFDYDHDGDLDCFVLNNSPKSVDNFGYRINARLERDPVNGDRLYRNDGNTFTDVSVAAGIYSPEIAFGLGVTAGDINNDGWEDLYIANDFFERDYLYINQHNGTFKDVISSAMGHISNGSMGTDMADINNDGYLDVFTAEMLPENNYRLKTTIRFDNYDVSNARNQLDFHHQFTCNTLQLNNQDGTFSEIAQLAGVDATGWSWGTLSFDFDNDGWKDIFVCNGIRKDLTNQDFLAYYNSQEMITRMKQGAFNFMDFIDKMPSVPIPNFAFKNQQDLTFTDQSAQLGFSKPNFSSGAAYADLDGDGDLDLVINNQNSEASVYKNRSAETLHHHFLKIKLEGTAPNTMGFGARITLFTGNQLQVLEQMPTRGFQSSVDPVLVFGIKNSTKIDSVVVQWPNQKIQVIRNPLIDTILTAYQKNATEKYRQREIPLQWYEDLSASIVTGNTKHTENEFVDFNVERLIPRMVSTEGPKLAVGDVNGDGLEDLYMGSAAGDTARIFLQKPNGHFEQKLQKIFTADAYYENTAAAFLDADNDGDLDLVAASGGNEAKPGSPYLSARLYINDGKGNFSYPSKGWPGISVNASCVRVLDFNNDGKPDIFIGARTIPGSYGKQPTSILLQNDGNGVFTNVTSSIAPGFEKLGMVTDAKWEDLEGDGKKELIIVGDWMPVVIFQYTNGKLQKKTELPHSSGWWNCVTVADVNGDGKPDLIAGNMGLNSNIKADATHPARLYVADFDNNGQSECIPVYYKPDGKAYPYYLKDEMESQLPGLKKKFLRYDVYAGKTIEEILTGEQIKKATVLTVEQTQTSIFINDGRGNFSMQALPVMTQLSPVYSIAVSDLNGDGKKDLFMSGNFYGLKPQTGRFDASYGTALISDGQHFKYHTPAETGLFIKGEARDIATVTMANGDRCIVVSINNDKLHFFQKRKNRN